MAFYYDFDRWVRDHPPVQGSFRSLNIERTARNLLDLRTSLDDTTAPNYVPPRTTHERLLVATWNLRQFGARERYEESLFYITEVISRFDIVALQEVKQSLTDLDTVRDLLGPWWRYVVTDVTAGVPGNEERLAILYDSRKVRFMGMAGELVLPPVRDANGNDVPTSQLARTPLLAGFKSGWFEFLVATVHVIWGDGVADHEARVTEVRQLAQHLSDWLVAPGTWARNLLLMGDFNLFAPEGQGAAALADAGFALPHGREDLRATNVGQEARYYDQIAYRFVREPGLLPTRIGVVDPFDAVYSNAKLADYQGEIRTSGGQVPANPGSYYRNTWRRCEISDHLLLWAELPIEFADPYLRRLAGV